jgi:hypothetical protein
MQVSLERMHAALGMTLMSMLMVVPVLISVERSPL